MFKPRASSLLLLGAIVGFLHGPSVAAATAQVGTPVTAVTACTTGSSGIGDDYFPTLGNTGYDVQHYDLEIDLDVDAGAIADGRAAITALATLPLCAFNLELEGLTIETVAVDGQPATYDRRGQELTIRPAAPLPAGAEFVVTIDYRGTPLGQAVGANGQPVPGATPAPAESGGAAREARGDRAGQQFGAGWWTAPGSIFVAGEPAGAETWYPVNGHPADKASYTFRLTVPEPYAVAANGLLTERIAGNGETTYVWDAPDPMASYLVTLHAGEIEIEESVGPGGLPIRNIFAAGVSEAQRDTFDRFPEMIEYFETVFGPYPFVAAGNSVVGVPIGFALETQTLATFGAAQVSPGASLSPAEVADQELVIAHELAHQWFGNAVSPLRWRETWLNEGFASYAEALWLEQTEGAAARDEDLAIRYRGLASLARFQNPETLATLSAADVLTGVEEVFGGVPPRLRRVYLDGLGATTEADLAALPAQRGLDQLAALGIPTEYFPGRAVTTGDPGPSDLFSPSAVYNRGALTLHALRQAVGDEAFFAILREWVARFGGGNATTADFIALSEEVSGQDLDPLFDAWLFETTLPPLSFGPDGAATPVAGFNSSPFQAGQEQG